MRGRLISRPSSRYVDDGVPRWLKLSAAVAAVVAAVIAVLAFFLGNGGGPTERKCTTNIGGMVVCGDYRDERIQRGNLNTFISLAF